MDKGRSGGTRGGRDRFNWEDVIKDKQRDNYLGASLHVTKVKTFNNPHPNALWYLEKEDKGANDDIAAIKAKEERLMLQAMGILPRDRPGVQALDKTEYSKLLERGTFVRDENDTSGKGHGLGFDAPKQDPLQDIVKKEVKQEGPPPTEPQVPWLQHPDSKEKKKDKKHKDKKSKDKDKKSKDKSRKDKKKKDKDKDKKDKDKKRHKDNEREEKRHESDDHRRYDEKDHHRRRYDSDEDYRRRHRIEDKDYRRHHDSEDKDYRRRHDSDDEDYRRRHDSDDEDYRRRHDSDDEDYRRRHDSDDESNRHDSKSHGSNLQDKPDHRPEQREAPRDGYTKRGRDSADDGDDLPQSKRHKPS